MVQSKIRSESIYSGWPGAQQTSQHTTLEGVGQDNLSAGQPDHVDGLHEIDNNQIIEEDDKTMEELVPSRTRTKIVKPPTHYQCWSLERGSDVMESL